MRVGFLLQAHVVAPRQSKHPHLRTGRERCILKKVRVHCLAFMELVVRVFLVAECGNCVTRQGRWPVVERRYSHLRRSAVAVGLFRLAHRPCWYSGRAPPISLAVPEDVSGDFGGQEEIFGVSALKRVPFPLNISWRSGSHLRQPPDLSHVASRRCPLYPPGS